MQANLWRQLSHQYSITKQWIKAYWKSWTQYALWWQYHNLWFHLLYPWQIFRKNEISGFTIWNPHESPAVIQFYASFPVVEKQCPLWSYLEKVEFFSQIIWSQSHKLSFWFLSELFFWLILTAMFVRHLLLKWIDCWFKHWVDYGKTAHQFCYHIILIFCSTLSQLYSMNHLLNRHAGCLIFLNFSFLKAEGQDIS